MKQNTYNLATFLPAYTSHTQAKLCASKNSMKSHIYSRKFYYRQIALDILKIYTKNNTTASMVLACVEFGEI